MNINECFLCIKNRNGVLITIASKINVVPISKLHSILAVTNLLAHYNMIKFVTAVKFHYKVLLLTSVFMTI